MNQVEASVALRNLKSNGDVGDGDPVEYFDIAKRPLGEGDLFGMIVHAAFLVDEREVDAEKVCVEIRLPARLELLKRGDRLIGRDRDRALGIRVLDRDWLAGAAGGISRAAVP